MMLVIFQVGTNAELEFDTFKIREGKPDTVHRRGAHSFSNICLCMDKEYSEPWRVCQEAGVCQWR
jgi:hypothetical protein